ncbi:hypothetical protein M3Y97_00781200 [Aphelenchoides bicaudatus]|nr:hypothetical protein M3Y97_00781200 [Aphelenchoides bicaudatus]
MNTWFGSFFLAVVALTFSAAQDFDTDSDHLLVEGMAKRRVAELIGKRDSPSVVPGFGREVRRTRELFGKRQAYPMPSLHRYLSPSADMELPAKRRTRELFGKRSADLSPLTSEQIEMLTTLMDRPRRRGGELFGR